MCAAVKRKTTVNIYDMEFTLVGEESEEYVQKVAGLVDERMREVASNGLSTVASAILTATNIADDYFKALDSLDAVKRQLREYFEEISRLKDEVDELRRATRGTKGGSRFRAHMQAVEDSEMEQSQVELTGMAEQEESAAPRSKKTRASREKAEKVVDPAGLTEPVESVGPATQAESQEDTADIAVETSQVSEPTVETEAEPEGAAAPESIDVIGDDKTGHADIGETDADR